LGCPETEGKSVVPVTGTTIFLRLKVLSKVRLLSNVPGTLLKNLTYNFNVVSGGITHLVSSLVISAELILSIIGIFYGSSIFDWIFLAPKVFFLSFFF
jgi:hypothetical protein